MTKRQVVLTHGDIATWAGAQPVAMYKPDKSMATIIFGTTSKAARDRQKTVMVKNNLVLWV